MSTSDPGSETLLARDSANSREVENPASEMASLPDLRLITRLANELFAALPGQAGTAAATAPSAPSGIDLRTMPSAVTDTVDVAPDTGLASPPAVSSFPGVQGSPSHLLEREKAGSPTAAPSYPSPSELFSLPGVPGVQSPPSIPRLPSPAPSLTEAELSAIPASLAEVTPFSPHRLASASPPAVPGAPAYLLEASPIAPLSVAPSFPGGNALISFPVVPAMPGLSTASSSPPPAPAFAPGDAAAGGTSPAYPSSQQSKPAQARSDPNHFEHLEFRPEIVPSIGLARRLFDPHIIKRDFPILEEQVNGRPLVWLDNAATTQKPRAVIDRLSAFYQHENSNIHRAAHMLAARATDAYESAREKVRRFLNAASAREIVFVRGTTEGINLVAKSWGHRNVQKDDEIVITWLEHHANIVPWQQLAGEKGARLRVAPVDDSGQVILEEYERLLGPRTRIVSVSQVSNALGTITPVKQMIEMAHRHGARVLVDGAQSVAHMATDVQALDCDFFVFSGHKIFAPTGVGVVFGKGDLLETTPPWQGGGNMIIDVTFEKTIYNVPPARFEAGTGTIADAVGLGAALDYVEDIGLANISRHEHDLVQYGTAQLLTVPGLRLIGTASEKAGVLSFVLDTIPPEEVGKALDQEGIAVRAGHHCAQPILRRLGVEKTVRPSLALYNTREDIDALVAALIRIQTERGHRG